MTRKEKRLARVTALQTSYACELSDNEPGIILAHLAEEEESQLTPEISAYAGKLVRLTIKNQGPVDAMIESRSSNWDIKRITLVDRLILRLALTEMMYVEDVPPKVSISEAVEIAKIFSTEDSSGFVNGILDSAYNDELKSGI